MFRGKLRCSVYVDSGADGNIMCARTVDEIIAAGVEVEVSVLHPHRVFDMAGLNKDGARAQLVCSKVASLDTELLIRHGSALLL